MSSCESLITLALSDTTITSAVSIPGPSFTAPDGQTYSGLPPFCQVTATLTPTTDSLINIWVWMPASNWSGRFEGTGNGGYAGTIAVAVPAMIAGLTAGSAALGGALCGNLHTRCAGMRQLRPVYGLLSCCAADGSRPVRVRRPYIFALKREPAASGNS